MRQIIRKLFGTICFLGVIYATPAFAACSNNEDGNPGAASEIEYFTATSKLMYCDDTNWVEMTSPYDTAAKTTTPLAYWKLDETSGGSVADSDPNSAPATRFSAAIKSGSYSIVRTDGTTIANNWADLTDGTLQATLTYNEYGIPNLSSSKNNMVTNVNTDGTQASSTQTCADWTANTGDNLTRGNANLTDSNWTNTGTLFCTNGGHIYCFEQ